MKTVAIGLLLFALAGCAEPLTTREKGMLGGAGIGGIAGGLMGGSTGALIGGGLGGLAGGFIGDRLQSQEHRRYRRRCYRCY